MHILILGNAADAHAVHLKNVLEQDGTTVDYWDTRLFPTQMQLSWQPDTRMGRLTLPGGRSLEIRQIHSVFWRSFLGVSVPTLKDPHPHQIAVNDAIGTLRSLLQIDSIHWVNSWKAYQFHQEKPQQLSRVKQLGVAIPATLISNSPADVIEFVRHHPHAIFKPVYGGAHTQRVTQEHLAPERLSLTLRLSPVTFQAYISGTNIRTYVIGETVYAAEIRSPSLDFREDLEAMLLPVVLPDSIKQQCLEIARALWLEWTAIDWRLTEAGEYVFLEANPSPMFLHFEQQTGFPITQQLVQQLTR